MIQTAFNIISWFLFNYIIVNKNTCGNTRTLTFTRYRGYLPGAYTGNTAGGGTFFPLNGGGSALVGT